MAIEIEKVKSSRQTLDTSPMRGLGALSPRTAELALANVRTLRQAPLVNTVSSANYCVGRKRRLQPKRRK